MIEYKQEYTYHISFDGMFCSHDCDSLSIDRDIEKQKISYPKCEAFNYYVSTAGIVIINDSLKIRRCPACIKRYSEE